MTKFQNQRRGQQRVVGADAAATTGIATELALSNRSSRLPHLAPMAILVLVLAIAACSSTDKSSSTRSATGAAAVEASSSSPPTSARPAPITVPAGTSPTIEPQAIYLGGRPVTDTFHYVGAHLQKVTVPVGATSADLRLVGGQGGKSCLETAGCAKAGAAAQVTGTIQVTPGETLTVAVAGAGHESDLNSAGAAGGWGWADGAQGGNAARGSGGGGGGGGASGIVISPCPDCTQSLIALAGGGGGAGGNGLFVSGTSGGRGGDAGLTAGSGSKGSGTFQHGIGGAGAGNGQRTGGAGGNGAHFGAGGGGGGGGHLGGAGGGGSGWDSGGGGGGAGSSYATPLTSPAVSTAASTDQNGVITISWDHVMSAPAMHLVAPRVVPGQPHLLTLTMSDTPEPTGTVTFHNQTPFGTDTVIGTAPIPNGVARLWVPPDLLYPGINSIHASYAGDANYLPSISNTVMIRTASPEDRTTRDLTEAPDSCGIDKLTGYGAGNTTCDR